MGFGSLVASAVGSIGGSILDYHSQKRANAQAARSIEDQMGFQRDMSGTAYQRAMEDMRKAGLNPMLAYTMGGASTPQGGSYFPEPTIQGAGASARDIGRLHNESRLMKQNLLESKSRVASNEAVKEAQRSTARRQDAEANLLETELPLTRERVQLDRKYLLLDSWLRRVGLIGGTARDAALTYRGLKGFSGQDVSETFGPQGEHKRTTIRSKGR